MNDIKKDLIVNTTLLLLITILYLPVFITPSLANSLALALFMDFEKDFFYVFFPIFIFLKLLLLIVYRFNKSPKLQTALTLLLIGIITALVYTGICPYSNSILLWCLTSLVVYLYIKQKHNYKIIIFLIILSYFIIKFFFFWGIDK